MSMERAVFLDRDGVINEDVGHLFSMDRLELISGSMQAMARLKERFQLFIVTNQSGIGEGVATRSDYDAFERAYEALLAGCKINVKRTYCCPHEKSAGCVCRKPSPRFLFEASRRFGIDLASSYVIGDHPHDVEMGKRAGARTVYVLSGHGAKHRDELNEMPDYVAANLDQAAEWVLIDSRKEG